MTTREKAEVFLMSAQALGAAMLEQIKREFPQDAEKLAAAVADGAMLTVGYTFGPEPVVELLLRTDDIARRIASLPAKIATRKPS